MLRTGTLALAAVIAALFMGGASAHAAAEAPPANGNIADALLLTPQTGVFLAARVEAMKELGAPTRRVPGGARAWYRWELDPGRHVLSAIKPGSVTRQ